MFVPPGGGRRLTALRSTCTTKADTGATRGAYVLVEEELRGEPTPTHRHVDAEEALHVLSGEVAVWLGTGEKRATAGSFVRVPRGVAHGLRRVDDDPVRLLTLASPPGFERFFEDVVRVGEAALLSDPGRLAELASASGTHARGLPHAVAPVAATAQWRWLGLSQPTPPRCRRTRPSSVVSTRAGGCARLTRLVCGATVLALRGRASAAPDQGVHMVRLAVATALAAVAVAAVATPAAAAPEPKEVALRSNGVGVCVSQIAIMPELIGYERLGQDVSNLARTGMLLEAMKTVRSPECGYPPGPGHLR